MVTFTGREEPDSRAQHQVVPSAVQVQDDRMLRGHSQVQRAGLAGAGGCRDKPPLLVQTLAHKHGPPVRKPKLNPPLEG